MQKTVLMITTPYYPSNQSGVHRPTAFAKYLPLHGWTPFVVCKAYTAKYDAVFYDSKLAEQADYCEVIRVPHCQGRVVKKLEHYAWVLFGGGKDDYRNPFLLYLRMRAATENLVRKRKIDAIWSTFMPGLDHAIASDLSRKHDIPWVADFRDLPDQSYASRNSRYAVEQEKRICTNARALVATTHELAAKLKQRHQAPVYTILNGFDPEEYECAGEDVEQDKKFTINHFGWLYPYRNPAVLFEGLDTLISRSTVKINDVRVGFYGAHAKIVRRFAEGFACAPQVKVMDRLNYKEMIACQKSSQVLLLLTSPQQGGAIPAKLYGYLASKRPILNVPGDTMGSDRILRETGAGVSLSEPEKVAAWLETAYRCWKESGRVPYQEKQSEIEKYSRKSQTAQLAKILKEICY